MIRGKTRVLAGVALLLGAANTVHARQQGVDFDGMPAAMRVEVSRVMPAMVGGHEVEVSPTESKRQAEALEKRVNRTIRSGIDYCKQREMEGTRGSLQRLLSHGTLREKSTYVYNKGRKYRVPLKFQSEPKFRMAVGGCNKCLRWQNEQVCNSREICKVVCWTAGGGIGGAVGGATGKICSRQCENLPECRTVETCAQWDYCW